MMTYESQNKLIILALIGFLGGILPMSLPIRNTKSYLNSTNIVYAKENNTEGSKEADKDIEKPDTGGVSSRLSIPQFITRFNRRTGKTESVHVPNEVGQIVCDPKYKWDCNKALTIISCESDFKEDVVSRTGDTGLFQIAPVHGYSISYLSNIRNNIDVGYQLFLKRSYQPWYSSYRCHHAK